jgi:hypothetical protein
MLDNFRSGLLRDVVTIACWVAGAGSELILRCSVRTQVLAEPLFRYAMQGSNSVATRVATRGIRIHAPNGRPLRTVRGGLDRPDEAPSCGRCQFHVPSHRRRK